MKRQARWLFVGGALLMVMMACAPTSMTYAPEQPILNPETKAEHEMVASTYEQRAKELETWARQHQDMAEHAQHYVPLKSETAFKQHCKALVSSYQAAANENMELAKLHRQLAAEAQP